MTWTRRDHLPEAVAWSRGWLKLKLYVFEAANELMEVQKTKTAPRPVRGMEVGDVAARLGAAVISSVCPGEALGSCKPPITWAHV